MPQLLTPTKLSTQPRTGDSADMKRRRWTIGLSIAGGAIGAIGAIVAAYQTGMIKRLAIAAMLPGEARPARVSLTKKS